MLCSIAPELIDVSARVWVITPGATASRGRKHDAGQHERQVWRAPRSLSREGNGFCTRSLSPMDRVFLAIICSGIILLVTALALQTPDAGALTIAVQQRVLPQ
jgi:hypothetical protein